MKAMKNVKGMKSFGWRIEASGPRAQTMKLMKDVKSIWLCCIGTSLSKD